MKIKNLFKKYVPTNFFSEKKMQKFVTDIKAAAQTEVSQEYERLLGKQSIGVGDNTHPDPFYADVTEEFIDDQQEEYKELKEAVTFYKSRGYFVNYNTTLMRELSDTEREYIQNASVIKAREDAHIASVVNNLQQYTLGKGLTFRAKHPDAQKLLDEFWIENDMEVKQKEIVWRTEVESEFFFLYVVADDGTVKVREIPPNQIKDVELHPNDEWERLSYRREYMESDEGGKIVGQAYTEHYPDINYYMQKEKTYGKKSAYEGDPNWKSNAFVHYVKLSKNRGKRGWPLLQKALKWAKYYENWLRDRIILNHERSRVVWIKKITSYQADALKRHKPAPSPGYMLVETDDVSYEAVNANINADQVKEDGLAILYAIAAATGIPMYVLAQRATEQVYSSIKEAGTPFHQMINDRQDFWREHFRKMFRFVLRKASEKNKAQKRVIITKYMDDIIREDWRRAFTEYKNGERNSEDIVRKARKSLLKFATTMQNDKTEKNVAHQIVESCNDVISDCDEAVYRLSEITTESRKLQGISIQESEENGIDLINKVNRIVERGINVKVELENVPIDVIFPDIARENAKEAADVLLAHKELGASVPTLLEKAGYDAEEEITRRRDFAELMGDMLSKETGQQDNQQDNQQDSASNNSKQDSGEESDSGEETDGEE